MDRGPAEPSAEVSVELLWRVDDGAPEGLIEGLAREVVAVSHDPARELGSEAPTERLLLAWLPASAADEELQRLVAYRDRAAARTALLGCAPVTGAADGERALAVGFDDFVAGRSSARELASRLRALSRRITGRGESPWVRRGPLALDARQHRLWEDGRAVPVTRTELAVLSALMRARGRTLSREELLHQAWAESDLEVGERAVDNVVWRLRRKLRTPGLLVTVRGVGFRLGTS